MFTSICIDIRFLWLHSTFWVHLTSSSTGYLIFSNFQEIILNFYSDKSHLGGLKNFWNFENLKTLPLNSTQASIVFWINLKSVELQLQMSQIAIFNCEFIFPFSPTKQSLLLFDSKFWNFWVKFPNICSQKRSTE